MIEQNDLATVAMVNDQTWSRERSNSRQQKSVNDGSFFENQAGSLGSERKNLRPLALKRGNGLKLRQLNGRLVVQ